MFKFLCTKYCSYFKHIFSFVVEQFEYFIKDYTKFCMVTNGPNLNIINAFSINIYLKQKIKRAHPDNTNLENKITLFDYS